MGAQSFKHWQEGISDSLPLAFYHAVEDARDLHGHDGYTGTLAEKTEFLLLEDGDELSYAEAVELADTLIEENDLRISDKWGPAGVFRVRDGNYDGYLFFGWASS